MYILYISYYNLQCISEVEREFNIIMCVCVCVRRASSMWHWPYCVNVGEKTFKNILTLLTKYGDVSDEHLPPPFTEKRCLYVCTCTSSAC